LRTDISKLKDWVHDVMMSEDPAKIVT